MDHQNIYIDSAQQNQILDLISDISTLQTSLSNKMTEMQILFTEINKKQEKIKEIITSRTPHLSLAVEPGTLRSIEDNNNDLLGYFDFFPDLEPCPREYSGVQIPETTTKIIRSGHGLNSYVNILPTQNTSLDYSENIFQTPNKKRRVIPQGVQSSSQYNIELSPIYKVQERPYYLKREYKSHFYVNPPVEIKRVMIKSTSEVLQFKEELPNLSDKIGEIIVCLPKSSYELQHKNQVGFKLSFMNEGKEFESPEFFVDSKHGYSRSKKKLDK
jgi:hypothetical protein